MNLPNMLPNRNEELTIRGGLGNKILQQIKNENDEYYIRNNPTEEWRLLSNLEILEMFKGTLKWQFY